MIQSAPDTLVLREYTTTSIAKDDLRFEEGEELWKSFGKRITVDFPSPRTGGEWGLTPQGWVGQLVLQTGRVVVFEPKVTLGNLFRMLEVAYRLESFHVLKGEVTVESLEDFYERLANLLAERILVRARRGLYREYVPRIERLPFVRGRIDAQTVAHRPWEVAVKCGFEDHTSDVEENQILLWTLLKIARAGMCTDRSRPRVRRALHVMQGAATPVPVSGQACLGRRYSRLNDDYQLIHGLCRFFLDHIGPPHGIGGHDMLPFLVDSARLFELFVACWLREQLPPGLCLEEQHRYDIHESGSSFWNMDLVLRDSATGAVRCGLDTKYKKPPQPSPQDVAQVVAYAEALDCSQAALVYPSRASAGYEVQVGRIGVTSIVFDLSGNLDRAGCAFLEKLNDLVGDGLVEQEIAHSENRDSLSHAEGGE